MAGANYRTGDAAALDSTRIRTDNPGYRNLVVWQLISRYDASRYGTPHARSGALE
jgi:hypothetical protein